MFASKLARKMAIAFAAQLLCICTAKEEDLASMPDVCSSSGGSRACDPQTVIDAQLLQFHNTEVRVSTAEMAPSDARSAAPLPAHSWDFRGCAGDVTDTYSSSVAHRVNGAECSSDGMVFDGSNDCVSIDGWEWGGAVTAELLVRKDDLNTGDQNLFLFGMDSVWRAYYEHDTACSPHCLKVYNSDSWAQGLQTTSFWEGTGWVHIVIVSDGSSVQLYRDAVLIDSVAQTVAFETRQRSVHALGCTLYSADSTASQHVFGGTIAYFRMYDMALSSSAVSELFHGTAPTPNPPDIVHASGDPHITNVRGERFDLLQPGKHTFLEIPRKSPPQDALLRVLAEVRNDGQACADMYIQAVNVTGKWPDAKRTGGFQYFAQDTVDKRGANWEHFGKVALKIVRGETIEGTKYLNIFAKNLGQAGYPVGGLLGEDDHTSASTPGEFCKHHVDLAASRDPDHEGMPRSGSIGEASLM